MSQRNGKHGKGQREQIDNRNKWKNDRGNSQKIHILSALFVISLIMNPKIAVINAQGVAFLIILKGIVDIKIRKAKMRQILQRKVMEITSFIQVKVLNMNHIICGTWIAVAATT